MTPVIDAHVHLSRSPKDALIAYARANGLEYNLGELTRLMKASNVKKGLLLSPPLTGGNPLPNEQVVRLCRESESRLFPILTVVPTKEGISSAISLGERWAKDVKGFKILLGYFKVYPSNRMFDPLYDYAQDRELPVMFHTGDTADRNGSLVHSHPLTLDAVANERPELKIVACHFGNPWIQDVGELIYKHENVFTDVSGLAVGDGRYAAKYGEWLTRQISEAIYFAGGAGKVIFGSDYPVTTQKTALRLVAELDVSERERTGILHGNAERVFGL
jgi:hypothetical protein